MVAAMLEVAASGGGAAFALRALSALTHASALILLSPRLADLVATF